MKVYIRNINETDAVPFGECGITEIGEVVAAMKAAGGVYMAEVGDMSVALTFQYCLDDDEGYAEIIVGAP